MKTLLKFTLLSALIITGRFAKQAAPATVAETQNVPTQVQADNSIVMVHQVLTSEPVKPAREQERPVQSGSGLLAELF